METIEEIYNRLLVEYPNLTTNINGEIISLTESEREATLHQWAVNEYNAQVESQKKVWRNVQDFVDEFTIEEMGAISLSTSPTIAALRFKLSAWFGEVWSTNPYVVAGMNECVAQNIITEQRKQEILHQV